MKKPSQYIVHILLATILSYYSCTFNKGEEVKPAEVVCATRISNVSFSADIQPILTNTCATSGCHSGNHPEGNLNLEASKAYSALSKPGSGYLDTQDPKGSVFYSSLVSISSPMPPDGPPLNACDLKRIEIWMKEGGLDN